MKLFLIRHGKTDAHMSKIKQSPDTPLGETGLKQAEAVGERLLKEGNIDVVFSSPWPRARQTAEKISQSLKKEIEYMDILHEKEQHESVYGVADDSEENQRYLEAIKQYGHDLDWKYQDGGESLNDVVARCKAFRDHLLSHHKHQSVIAVTHGNFLKCFLGLILLGEDMDPRSFHKLYERIIILNTGISVVLYDEDRNEWKVEYINDHLHIR